MAKQAARARDVRDAIAAAHAYLKLLVPEARGIRLEEVEKPKDWEITLSYLDPDPDVLRGLASRAARLYKLFRVSDATGEVHSMKIRQLVGT